MWEILLVVCAVMLAVMVAGGPPDPDDEVFP